MKLLTVLLSLCCSTLAFADDAPTPTAPPAPAPSAGKVERLLGYSPSSLGITFQVTSGGCTKPEDFKTVIKRNEVGVVQVALVRVRPDVCYPFLPMGTKFRLSYDQLGINNGERFMIMNPNGIVYGWVWEQSNAGTN